jgi:hypothetical protein
MPLKRIRLEASTSSWVVYDVKLSDSDPPQLHDVQVSGSKIVDSDIALSIGKRVAVKCYRDDPESVCYASS